MIESHAESMKKNPESHLRSTSSGNKRKTVKLFVSQAGSQQTPIGLPVDFQWTPNKLPTDSTRL